VPHTSVARDDVGHSYDEDRPCCGGALARGGDLVRRVHDGRVGVVGHSGGHLRPEEAGELSRDRGDDDLADGLLLVEAPELAREVELGAPRPCDELRGGALLAAPQGETDVGLALIDPRRLDEMGAQVEVSRRG